MSANKVWCLAVLALSGVGSTQSPRPVPTPDVEWLTGDKFSDHDKGQILELAKTAGITDPRRAETILTNMPLGCLAVQIDSVETVDGPRRRSRRALIGRNAAHYCPPDQPTKPGDWGIWRARFSREVWRVEDGAWHVDVVLNGVSYDIARQIVLAMRNKTAIDRRTRIDPPFTAAMPPLEGEFVLSARGSSYEAWETGGGSGFVYEFAVSHDKVELLSADMWIS